MHCTLIIFYLPLNFISNEDNKKNTEMKKLQFLLRILTVCCATLPLYNYSTAHAEKITHEGIIYEKVNESQLTIIDFERNNATGIYRFTRNIYINNQEYTVVNTTPLKADHLNYIDSLEVPEFFDDLIVPADLKQMKNLKYLKISENALGNFKDYRNVTKYINTRVPLALDFFSQPKWVKIRNGIHYSADGKTLLFTGTHEAQYTTQREYIYLPSRVKRIAPYAIGPTNRMVFLVMPANLQSISPNQKKYSGSHARNWSEAKNDQIYLYFNDCFTDNHYVHVEDYIHASEQEPEHELLLAMGIASYALKRYGALWIRKQQNIAWRLVTWKSAGGTITPSNGQAELTITKAEEMQRPYKYWYPNSRTKRIVQDTTVKSKICMSYHLEATPGVSQRFVGFMLPHDTIVTSNNFCWSIGELKITMLFANENEFKENFDYLLSEDKKSLKWWNNPKDVTDISILNLPNVTRCERDFMENPPTSGTYTIPTSLSKIGPYALSNVPTLRELVINHDVTLEPSSLAGCSSMQIIKVNTDVPLAENTIRDAFFPDPVPTNLRIVIPKEKKDAWSSIAGKLGAPVVFVPNVITISNQRKKHAAMAVHWKNKITDTTWHYLQTDSIELPGCALFNVIFTPHLAYDFDSICTLNDGNSFPYRDTILATQDYKIIPKCHLVKYKILFSSPKGGTLKTTSLDGANIDSGSYIVRGEEIEFKATPSAHKRFAKFTVNGSSIYQNPYQKTVRSLVNVVAFFKPIVHAVTVEKENNCTWEIFDSAEIPVPTICRKDSTIWIDSLSENCMYTFRPIANPGFTIDKAWVNGKLLGNTDTTLSVEGPITLRAETKRKNCFISVPDAEIWDHLLIQQSDGIPVAPNSYIPWGETVTIKARIAERYFSFVALVINNIRYHDKNITITAENDTLAIDLIAEPINFVVYIEPNNYFKATLTSPLPVNDEFAEFGYWGVLPDQHVTIALNAATGWIVEKLELQWEGINKETIYGACKEGTVKANLTVTPKLTRTVYHIDLPTKKKSGNILAYGKNLNEIKSSTKLFYGDTISLLPQAGEGYELKSLSVNGTIMPPRQTELVVTKDIIVSAVFDKISYGKTDTLVVDNQNATLRFAGHLNENNVNFETTAPLADVTTIAAEAFAYNPHTETVIVNGKVKTIESRAFFGCHKLQSIVIGPNVRYIGAQAFAGADLLSIVDVLQTNPDTLTIDPAIFHKTRGVAPQCVFRVPNEAYNDYRKHPKWQHVSVVPQTVNWTFALASSDLQLNITIEERGKQQHLAVRLGESVVEIPGGSIVMIESAGAAPKTITRIAIDNAATALPCIGTALSNCTISVLESETNAQRKTAVDMQQQRTLVRAYPNPTLSILRVECLAGTPLLEYTLRNSQGTVIKTGYFNSQLATLNMSKLAPGVYILRVNNGMEQQSLLVVKL